MADLVENLQWRHCSIKFCSASGGSSRQPSVGRTLSAWPFNLSPWSGAARHLHRYDAICDVSPSISGDFVVISRVQHVTSRHDSAAMTVTVAWLAGSRRQQNCACLPCAYVLRPLLFLLIHEFLKTQPYYPLW